MAPGAPPFDVEQEATRVQRDVTTINDALFAGDTDTLLRYTFPAIVQKMGGEEKFRKAYAQVAASQKRMGITRESLTFPQPPEFIEGKDGRLFAVIPNEVIVTGGGSRAAMTGFQVGVKEAGAADWKYVPGQFVTEDTLPALLPDFPAQHPLPPRSSKRLSS